MLSTPMARRGMVSSPHHLASQAGLAVLREGGNAIEAAIAVASALGIVLPHLNGLGGDGFWLIAEPGKPPISIDGSGASGGKVDCAFYRGQHLSEIPARGPLAAANVAGAVSAWQLALDVSAQWGGGMPLDRLFEDAIDLARNGFAVTRGQAEATERTLPELKKLPGFAGQFLAKTRAPQAGAQIMLPKLADTLERLADRGLDDFYRGEIARAVAEDLKQAGSPLRSDDLARHRGMRRRPLSLGLQGGTVFNTAPPTQGLASLILLGVFQRLSIGEAEGFLHHHGLIEAAKQAFMVRDAHVADPHRMSVHATTYLSEPLLERMVGEVNRLRAAPVSFKTRGGDSTWFGIIDGQGRAVSVVQSLHMPFGSGLVLPQTGIVWHDRTCAFSLDPDDRNVLEPRRKPFHTLSPALARLKDGRTMVWGASGGDGQPQIQAQVFTRSVVFGQDLQSAVSAPRWVVRRTLDMEGRFAPDLVERLRAAGHTVEVMGALEASLGQAGALARRQDGMIEGAADPRGDGSVAGW